MVSTQQALVGWFQELQVSGTKEHPVLRVGNCTGHCHGRGWGQRSFPGVRAYFTIPHVPGQDTASSLCTLTPQPGSIFPTKSPEGTWLGTSLSEAATLKQALKISGLSEKAGSGVLGPRGSPLAGWQFTLSTSSLHPHSQPDRQAGDCRSIPTAQRVAGPQPPPGI